MVYGLGNIGFVKVYDDLKEFCLRCNINCTDYEQSFLRIILIMLYIHRSLLPSSC